MKLLIVLLLVAAASAALQTYSTPDAGQHGGVPLPAAGEHSAGAGACRDGEILHVDGTCVTPEINQKVYVFNVPAQPRELSGPPPNIPPPRVDHNILFVRLPEEGPGPEPIVLPPPRQESIVYVLNKKTEEGQKVIEVPAHPQTDPEVYFVNYEEGENPTLPIGVDLQTALSVAGTASGQVLGGAGGLGGAHGGFGGAAGAAGGQAGFSGAAGATGGHGGSFFNGDDSDEVTSGFGTGTAGLSTLYRTP
ncbi:DEAD-box ATP-dependent RNA helicase 9, mitochondrial-like [Penaeus japonicus]|uniref:DEAD-box ATP-dependent RNA helicase 9, mitochondrial-like n=1 Tax=Penaeus japonicus TaxID=27405 RepID=UPI001C7176FE|nr:DEAD-box ATP-dependent RNA helicase 9, mitochondrial-like [Penaeus japonicus]